MMEETLAEWGQVIALKTPSQLPLRHPLLKVFASATPPHFLQRLAATDEIGDFSQRSQGLGLVPFAKRQLSIIVSSALHRDSLAVNYSHPRFIDHPETQEAEHKAHNPIVPVLLLTAMSTFTAWYVYRLTSQKLDLQTQVREYADQLQYEKQAKTAIVSAQVKIFTLAGANEHDVSAKVFWDTENQSCLIYLNHLPKTTAEQYFQLWFYTKDDRFVKSKGFQSEGGAVELNI